MREWLDRYPLLRDKFVIVMAGRLRRLKGHPDFLRILSLLGSSGARVHGVIVGDDTGSSAYVAELHREAARADVPVTFVGYRSDMKDVYAAADLVISLSRQPESFGRSVLEPLCLGIPVVGYGHGGVGEILDRMFPQGAVPAGDVQAATSRVEEFMRRPCIVPRENPFPLDTMLERTVELYERLADGRVA